MGKSAISQSLLQDDLEVIIEIDYISLKLLFLNFPLFGQYFSRSGLHVWWSGQLHILL